MRSWSRVSRVAVDSHIFEGMPRGGFFNAPEDQDLAAEIRRSVEECWASATYGAQELAVPQDIHHDAQNID